MGTSGSSVCPIIPHQGSCCYYYISALLDAVWSPSAHDAGQGRSAGDHPLKAPRFSCEGPQEAWTTNDGPYGVPHSSATWINRSLPGVSGTVHENLHANCGTALLDIWGACAEVYHSPGEKNLEAHETALSSPIRKGLTLP
ncbi:hypothetical protein I7I51_01551 [Histoplasma capsulatum]|uniref:Uncharacterized protein n=1 Tax=Ajellomyces capsulatus TaxID=5037 RepID=A0A8A1MIJ0_AJECA|nr:hypothetical protein I7I51_01551 [Histoplasma capsulatum]